MRARSGSLECSRHWPTRPGVTRRDLVARLASADATVGELAEPYDMSLQAVSKHLKVLEEAGRPRSAIDASTPCWTAWLTTRTTPTRKDAS